MATRISAIVPFLLITLCCIGIVEGGYMALEYLLLRSKMRSERQRTEIVSTSPAKKADNGKNPGYQIILARNLFAAVPGNETHRSTAGAESLDNLQATNLGIVLMGTIGDNEGGNRAIILDPKTLEQKLYRQGDGVQGAVIKEIRRGKVVLTSGGRDEILDMSEAAKLRPLQTAADGNQAGAFPPDSGQTVAERSTLEKPPTDETYQQNLPQAAARPEPTAKRIVRPLIIRAVRPPASN